MLAAGMEQKGHEVEVWSPKPFFHGIASNQSLKKWMGYIDQYLLFPFNIKSKIKATPANTLFVFTDHALGPWVPLVSNRHHVIHCHDFLAQRSALGEIPENKTGWTGKRYQKFIRDGFGRGKHFISISKQTEQELQRFLPIAPLSSNVVYNGLNQRFEIMDKSNARAKLAKQTGLDLSNGLFYTLAEIIFTKTERV